MPDSTTTPATAPAGQGRSPAARPVPALLLALIAGPLSFGIAGPSLVLDTIAGDLGTSADAVTWTVTAFGWGIAVGTPLMAGLLRHKGARTALSVCALLVIAGAALVFAVPVLPALIAGCALQALGTAGLTAAAMHLADTSPLRMGLVTASLAVVGSTAPLAGSLANDVLSWKLTLALPVLSVLAVPAVLRRAHSEPSREHFDALGAVLLTALVTALVFVPHYPLPATLASAAALLLLIRHLRSKPRGFVPAVVVDKPAFLIAAVLAFVLAVVNFGLMFAIPDRLGEHTTWSAGQIGIAMVWPLVLGGTLSWFVVAASARLGRRPIIIVLLLFGIAAPVVTEFGTTSLVLLAAQALASIAAASGQGVFAVQATSALPDEERPSAIGLFNLCYLLGAAFGPAIVALLATT
ncbi:MFS transporter [Streptomyces sp. LHD-70]|uniref:MFS transporter n=1 Tax=Streptomyces sp. LHD-70 TaxID=3072140 RepID=UPI00281096B9|nr:MFS transporter [Streptomyces sp. LHD-70]MDQ8707910.1 MFS transporter [Streptomyces sp. LHD-70]